MPNALSCPCPKIQLVEVLHITQKRSCSAKHTVQSGQIENAGFPDKAGMKYNYMNRQYFFFKSVKSECFRTSLPTEKRVPIKKTLIFRFSVVGFKN